MTSEEQVFYSNGLTMTINQSEGILTFVRRVPIISDTGEMLGEEVESKSTIIVPRRMIEDLPRIIQLILDQEASKTE